MVLSSISHLSYNMKNPTEKEGRRGRRRKEEEERRRRRRRGTGEGRKEEEGGGSRRRRQGDRDQDSHSALCMASGKGIGRHFAGRLPASLWPVLLSLPQPTTTLLSTYSPTCSHSDLFDASCHE